MEIERFQQAVEGSIGPDQPPVYWAAFTLDQLVDQVYRAEHSERVKRGIANARANRGAKMNQGGAN